MAVLDGRLIVMGGESGAQAVVHDGKVYVAAGSRTRGATEITSQEVCTPAP